jgi:hypothetical protein
MKRESMLFFNQVIYQYGVYFYMNISSRNGYRTIPYYFTNATKGGIKFNNTKLSHSTLKLQSHLYLQRYNLHCSSLSSSKGSWIKRIRPLRLGLSLGTVTIAGIGIYLLNGNNYKKLERDCTDLAITYLSQVPLLLVTKKHLVDELFLAVYKGNFEKAKFLIKIGVDINTKEKSFNSSSVLLEEFYPKTESDLEYLMDFTNFILNRGYKHLNRPIGGKTGACNLLTNIYNHHIFSDQPDLRRKLIAFFLEKGVNPLHDSKYLGTPLTSACFYGDAEFFMITCKNLNINLHLEMMSEKKSFELLNASVLNGFVKDILFLLTKDLKIKANKNELLKSLEQWSFNYSLEDVEKIKKAIENAQT